MKELSLHILDIVENSIKACAQLIKVTCFDSTKENKIIITIEDDGCGMDKQTLAGVTNPFFTTRTTRHVGLGLPLFKEASERCGGKFFITSEPNAGTKVVASFEKNNIDTAPIGNISETVITIINSLPPNCELIYKHITDNNLFEFSTLKIKEILDGVDINSPEVLNWIKKYIDEAMIELYNN